MAIQKTERIHFDELQIHLDPVSVHLAVEREPVALGPPEGEDGMPGPAVPFCQSQRVLLKVDTDSITYE